MFNVLSSDTVFIQYLILNTYYIFSISYCIIPNITYCYVLFFIVLCDYRKLWTLYEALFRTNFFKNIHHETIDETRVNFGRWFRILYTFSNTFCPISHLCTVNFGNTYVKFGNVLSR